MSSNICVGVFTSRYSVLSGTRLMQRANTMETWDLYWFGALEKRAKTLRLVATCLYYDLVEQRDRGYKMAMPMRVSMIAIERVGRHLYSRPTCPTSYMVVP